MRRATLIGLLATACVGPFAPPPAVSPASIPSAHVVAGPDQTVSFPDCDARTVPGSLPACELLQAAADRDVFVGVLRRAAASGITYEARAIELATGATRALRPPAELELIIEDVRDAVVLLRETEDFGGGEAHVALLRIPWRDPARLEVLDEVDLVGLRGGNAWNPWPYAKTNGRDVVWLRGGGLSARHELLLLSGAGAQRTLLTTDRALYFDIDDSGRVAVAITTAAGQELQLFDAGRLRTLGSRTADSSTDVMSFGDLIGWPRGPATLRPVTEVEIVPIAGGAPRSARAETSCFVVGWTARDLVTVCASGVRLIDVATGAIRGGPAGRIVLAFRRALLWRTSADLASNPEVWRITLI
jgi:hypothetical protein